MSQPYVGEIRMFAGNFAPVGWAFCAGQTVPISEYETLFNLIGTTYGGDGQQTFALPNLQSRIPMHMGQNFVLGQAAGEEQVTLTTQQVPAHTHAVSASTASGTQSSPAGNTLAGSATVALYNGNPPNQALAAQTGQSVGGSQPHDNMQPFLVLNFSSSLFGVFPSRT
jgi:microcystin-dependent protein